MLSEAMVATKLIPNGVDLSTFHPSDKAAARKRLHLPQDERILLFSGFMPVASPFKDYPDDPSCGTGTWRTGRPPQHILPRSGRGKGHEEDGRSDAAVRTTSSPTEARVATFYQAADVYVHAARVGAENHSLSIMEALACGTPVVATDVGGIPEQIMDLWIRRDVAGEGRRGERGNRHPYALTRSECLGERHRLLLGRDDLLRALSVNAGKDARQRFDIQTQVDTYLAWYREIIGGRTTGAKRVAPEERGP